MKNINTELTSIGEQLKQEQKLREDSESATIEMLKDVLERVKQELSGEKKVREETEDHLLTLLEDTCNKLNSAAT